MRPTGVRPEGERPGDKSRGALGRSSTVVSGELLLPSLPPVPVKDAGRGGRGGYADIGRCTLIDCSSPTATHTANIAEPP